jgi:hypothetical protein
MPEHLIAHEAGDRGMRCDMENALWANTTTVILVIGVINGVACMERCPIAAVMKMPKAIGPLLDV